MQLLHEHKPSAIREFSNINTNMSIPEASSHYYEVKEKRSSNASLLLMNPVASGDNVANDLNCAQKLKEELPPLIPCCEGRELQINEDLVRSGLSAISVKHEGVIQCLSMSNACEKLQVPPGLVKHRNSFRCLHRPDLKRVPYLRRLSPDELELLFRGYADFPKLGSAKSESGKEATSTYLHPDKSETRDFRAKAVVKKVDGNAGPLHPIPEARSRLEDVPVGMRLHGTRAKLYTSVLAGAKAGDQLDNSSTNEEYDTQVVDDPLPEEEIQLNEELQIILPPRCDDVTAESSVASPANSRFTN